MQCHVLRCNIVINRRKIALIKSGVQVTCKEKRFNKCIINSRGKPMHTNRQASLRSPQQTHLQTKRSLDKQSRIAVQNYGSYSYVYIIILAILIAKICHRRISRYTRYKSIDLRVTVQHFALLIASSSHRFDSVIVFNYVHSPNH